MSENSEYAGASRTRWGSGAIAPVREFLRTQAGSSGVLLAAIATALIWSNVDGASYEAFWRMPVSFQIGDISVSRDVRTWVNSGLMTFFFLVVGLEARREIDLGDLRDRRRWVLPVVAGVAGMVLPVLIFLGLNAGGPGQRGWGVAMSTDSALALGLLAFLGRAVPERVRAFLLTVFIVDDVVALVVIVFYSSGIRVVPLVVALAVFGVFVAAALARVRSSALFVVLGFVTWAALLDSGVDPVVAGLAIGLTGSAYSPARGELEQASGLFRLFREQPTPELARSAAGGVTAALSPNARLLHFYHPWTSYVVVPLFGLANAGLTISGDFLSTAYRAPVTLGVIFGYVVGKPVAIIATSWGLARLSGGRFGPHVGWAAVAGSGTIAGVGFTVSLLMATLVFRGPQLVEARLGILTAAAVSSLATWIVFGSLRLLSPTRRALALLGDSEELIDLAAEVDPVRDHVRGSPDAMVTLVEYGDFECPYCGLAEAAVREVLAEGEVRYVWRHLPLTDVHPDAQLAAEAAEAAGAQGKFWAMHDLLFASRERLKPPDLMGYATELGLDLNKFHDDLRQHVHAVRVAQDVESADLSGVAGTPTFFINGRRHYGAYDAQTLNEAIKAARIKAGITSSDR